MTVSLTEAAARVIGAQAPELQEALVSHIAGYLSSQPEIHLKAEEIADMLHEKMKGTMTQGAMASWQERLYDHNGLPTTPSF